MKELNLFGQKFYIKNNKLTVEDIDINYNFTNNLVEIFQFIVSNNYDDYYLERVYKYIVKLKDSEYLLNECNSKLRYTEKICTIIKNSCKNPGGELEYNILRLLTIDISYLKYIEKLDELVLKLMTVDKILNNKYYWNVSNRTYSYKVDSHILFEIEFNKYNFDFSIECNSGNQYILVNSKLINIKDLDYNKFNVVTYQEISRTIITFEDQSYKIFDDLIKYLLNII